MKKRICQLSCLILSLALLPFNLRPALTSLALDNSTLSLSKSSYTVGEPIVIHYTGTANKDWIGIYPDGTEPGSANPSIDWKYTGDIAQPDGTVELSPDLAVGTYNVKLLKDDGYDVLASVTFQVTEKPLLSLSKSTYAVGEPIVIHYTGTSNKDWIGIYPDGTVPSSDNPSIDWKYTSDVAQPDGTMELSPNLAAGTYHVKLLKDDGYDILADVTFQVTETVLPKPVAVTFHKAGAKTGYADGVVKITPASSENGVTGYVLYWGNQNGKLENYTPIATIPVKGGAIEYQMVGNTIIPSGVTKIMAFTTNGANESAEYAEAAISSGSVLPDQQPLYKFQVMSDTHVTSNAQHTHNKNFDKALKDIKATAADSLGIVIVGDLTDSGFQSEYDQVKAIVDANKTGLPSIYYAVGNHDQSDGHYSSGEYDSNPTGTWEDEVALFKKNTGMSNVFYDKWIHDQHFIVLGSQTACSNKVQADIFDDQLSWFQSKLAQTSSFYQPIFVFLHQPFHNTVAGSLQGQGWDGVLQDAKVRSVLDQYPQAIMFSGHTHWELDSKNNMFDGEGTQATMFNDASCGYLWTDANTEKEGSQGYYVEVYSDKVLVKGRDFKNSKWVSSAQFIVDLTTAFEKQAEAIPTSENGLISQKGKVQQVLSDISSMAEDQQDRFAALKTKMTALLSQIDELQNDITELGKMVNQLPASGKLSSSDRKTLNKAIVLFNSMTKEQQNLLSKDLIGKLKRLSSDNGGKASPSDNTIEPPDTGVNVFGIGMLITFFAALLSFCVAVVTKKKFCKGV